MNLGSSITVQHVPMHVYVQCRLYDMRRPTFCPLGISQSWKPIQPQRGTGFEDFHLHKETAEGGARRGGERRADRGRGGEKEAMSTETETIQTQGHDIEIL